MTARAARRRQRGSAAVLFGMALPLILGLCALALELSLVFQRQAQLQQVADAVALSAAQQLDGTAAGVANAYQRALAATVNRQVRGAGSVVLGTDTLSFAGSPDGSWLAYDAAYAAPGGLRYARADMAALGASFTTLASAFGTLLAPDGSTTLGARAVAGPNGLRVLPFAICAASAAPSALRANGGGANELVEYGFRYGVGYNLLALNPAAGAASGEYFLIDPLSPPGSTPLPASTDDAQLAPFMCSGKLAYAALAGSLNLRRNGSFGLWQQLNSRFGSYGGSPACDPYAAPPDTNVRAYVGSQASWMGSAPPQASAASSTPAAGKPLLTIADGTPPLPAAAPAQYGTLWAFNAARRSSGTAFSPSSWSTLYPAAPALSASGWTANPTPYQHAAFSSAPSTYPGRRERRLLYVPLLACPIAAGTHVQGSMLALARFLLTAPASASEVPGEFAGIVGADGLSTDVELLR